MCTMEWSNTLAVILLIALISNTNQVEEEEEREVDMEKIVNKWKQMRKEINLADVVQILKLFIYYLYEISK